MKSQEDPAHWLPDARAGSQEALGKMLEACRHYLLLIANQQIGPDLKAKAGGSDLVQQTFLEAQRDFAQFNGESEEELLAWLRQLLLHNLANFQRHYRATSKRRIGREVALETGSSSTQSGPDIPAGTPSPSHEAMANEEAVALEKILQRLPAEYREVILYRHQQQMTFEDIGKRMSRSTSGARTLWLRAVERLNQEMEDSHESG
jgi:RNA polymerase sigma-70 factor, ECF subfamily